jgi:hypothetical protein
VQLKLIIILNAYFNVILTHKKHDGREFEFLMLDLGERLRAAQHSVGTMWLYMLKLQIDRKVVISAYLLLMNNPCCSGT